MEAIRHSRFLPLRRSIRTQGARHDPDDHERASVGRVSDATPVNGTSGTSCSAGRGRIEASRRRGECRIRGGPGDRHGRGRARRRRRRLHRRPDRRARRRRGARASRRPRGDHDRRRRSRSRPTRSDRVRLPRASHPGSVAARTSATRANPTTSPQPATTPRTSAATPSASGATRTANPEASVRRVAASAGWSGVVARAAATPSGYRARRPRARPRRVLRAESADAVEIHAIDAPVIASTTPAAAGPPDVASGPEPQALPEPPREHPAQEEAAERGRGRRLDAGPALDERRAPEHDRELDRDGGDQEGPRQPVAGGQPAANLDHLGRRIGARPGAEVERDDDQQSERRDEPQAPRQPRWSRPSPRPAAPRTRRPSPTCSRARRAGEPGGHRAGPGSRWRTRASSRSQSPRAHRRRG